MTHLVVYGQLDEEDRKEDDPAGKEDHQNERGSWYEAHSNTLTTVPTSHVVLRTDLQSYKKCMSSLSIKMTCV